MFLTVKEGALVIAHIEGHSSLNGAVIPGLSVIELTSNDPTVAAAGIPNTFPPEGAQAFDVGIVVMGVGSTDIHLTVTTPDGTIYEDTATLVVEKTPEPGLVRVTITLVEV